MGRSAQVRPWKSQEGNINLIMNILVLEGGVMKITGGARVFENEKIKWINFKLT